MIKKPDIYISTPGDFWLDREWDESVLFNARNSACVRDWTRQNDLLNQYDHKAYLSTTSDLLYAMQHRPADKTHFIGLCGICNINWVHRYGELSFYLIDQSYEIYAKPALQLLHWHAFNWLNLHMLTCEVIKNHPINKFLLEIGYHNDGKRDGQYWKDGKWVEIMLGSITKLGSVLKEWTGND